MPGVCCALVFSVSHPHVFRTLEATACAGVHIAHGVVWTQAQVFCSYLQASQAAAGTQSGHGTLNTGGCHPSRADTAPGCINRGTASRLREGTRPALPMVEVEGLRREHEGGWTVKGAEESGKMSSGVKGNCQTSGFRVTCGLCCLSKGQVVYEEARTWENWLGQRDRVTSRRSLLAILDLIIRPSWVLRGWSWLSPAPQGEAITLTGQLSNQPFQVPRPPVSEWTLGCSTFHAVSGTLGTSLSCASRPCSVRPQGPSDSSSTTQGVTRLRVQRDY